MLSGIGQVVPSIAPEGEAGEAPIEPLPLGKDPRCTVVPLILIVRGPLETVAGHWIWDTSRGNPLYVRELLLAALDQGALTEVNGIWRLRKRPLLEGLFADLLSSRLTCVSRAEEHALALLAFGEPLRVSELVDLTGAEPLTALERRGLVSVDCSHPRGEAKLAHPLYGEAVRG